MKKVMLFIIGLFILTGCQIRCDVDLDKYTEDIVATDVKDSENKNLYDVYSKKPIPLSIYSPILSQSDEKIKNVSYYDIIDVSDGEKNGLRFTGKFDKDSFISDSVLLKYATKDLRIILNDDSYSIKELNHIKLFDQFSNLDELTINVKTRSKVINTNADKRDGNVYTWIITRDNYMDKVIDITLSNKSFLNGLQVSNKPVLNFAIVLFIIVLIGFAIVLIVRKISKERNTF